MNIVETIENQLKDANRELANFENNGTLKYELKEVPYEVNCEHCEKYLTMENVAYEIDYLDGKYVCNEDISYYLRDIVTNTIIRLDMAKEIYGGK